MIPVYKIVINYRYFCYIIRYYKHIETDLDDDLELNDLRRAAAEVKFAARLARVT